MTDGEKVGQGVELDGPRQAFGAWLKLRRTERALSQADLARAIDCGHYTFVSSVETGRRPMPFAYVAPLAQALAVEPRDLAIRMLGAYEPNLAAMLRLT